CPSTSSLPPLPAPASSFPSPASAVTSAGTVLRASLGVASENPRWAGNLVDSRPPTREKQRLPPIASGSCATKILPRNTRRAKSWSSCVDDTAVAPIILFIHRLDRRKVQLIHHVGHQINQVVMRQPFAEARRQT